MAPDVGDCPGDVLGDVTLDRVGEQGFIRSAAQRLCKRAIRETAMTVEKDCMQYSVLCLLVLGMSEHFAGASVRQKRASTVLHAEAHRNFLGCAQELEDELNVLLNVLLNESHLLNQLTPKMWMPALSMVVGNSGSEEGESVTLGIKR